MPKLYFHRTSEYANNARSIAVFIDGKKALTIPNGGSEAIEVSAEKHQVYAKIDWCYSPNLELDVKETDKIKIEVSSYKMGKWLIPTALVAAALYFIIDYFFGFAATWLFVIVVPVFLYQLYFLTFGRKRYLQLTLLND